MQSATVMLKIVEAAAWPVDQQSKATQARNERWWQADDGTSYRGYCEVDGSFDASWVQLSRLTALNGASFGMEACWHYVVETDIRQGFEDEFNAWYDTEHLPGLAKVPGTIAAQRFVRHAEGPRYIACYDLVAPAVMASAPWLAVRHTPWSDRVRPMFHNTKRTLHRALPGNGT